MKLLIIISLNKVREKIVNNMKWIKFSEQFPEENSLILLKYYNKHGDSWLTPTNNGNYIAVFDRHESYGCGNEWCYLFNKE